MWSHHDLTPATPDTGICVDQRSRSWPS